MLTNNQKRRIEFWKEISKSQINPERLEVKAGREAEEMLQSLVAKRVDLKSASIFSSKRVPSDPRHPNQKRFEIDLIVISQKQISAIEIKNWSGRLKIDGDQWVQERYNKSIVSHEDPLRKNRRKLDALCGYLESKGASIPKKRICRVIFCNKNLEIPQNIAENPDVITIKDLDKFLGDQKYARSGEKFLTAVLEICLSQEKSKGFVEKFFGSIPDQDYKRTSGLIEDLSSFDKVVLWGGRTLTGDLIDLKIGPDSYCLKSLSKGSAIEVSCHRTENILGKASQFFVALRGSKPLLSLSGALGSQEAAPHDRIFFHAAGTPKPQHIELREISSIARG